eukprot:646536-Prymnesium_polylepis.2
MCNLSLSRASVHSSRRLECRIPSLHATLFRRCELCDIYHDVKNVCDRPRVYDCPRRPLAARCMQGVRQCPYIHAPSGDDWVLGDGPSG